ncbi:hypothetical protein [Cytophaga aurantiaca]|uniref:hypothetical protein n=1 Tax=Cytophaga aurantiaca TaxID=29530 RepID=UPI0012F8E4C2|nr:hypothetical protein [Cytophaga aurantiaca]
MKQIHLLIILLLFSSSCTDKEVSTESNAQVADSIKSAKNKSSNNHTMFAFDKVQDFFIHSNIKNIDSLNDFDPTVCRRMTEEEYYSAFQDESDGAYDADYNGAYYYSNQGVWDGFSRFIFVKKDETCCTMYHYKVYDSNGKLTGTFVAAAEGGDGGWVINKEPVFLNDSTIKTITVECEYGIDETQKETGDCDSTITLYHLLKDGSIKEVKQSTYKITK